MSTNFARFSTSLRSQGDLAFGSIGLWIVPPTGFFNPNQPTVYATALLSFSHPRKRTAFGRLPSVETELVINESIMMQGLAIQRAKHESEAWTLTKSRKGE